MLLVVVHCWFMLIVLGCFQLLSVALNCFWLLVTGFGWHWLCLMGVWLVLMMVESSWLFVNGFLLLFDCFWLCSVAFDCLWLSACFSVLDRFWSCLVWFECCWLFLIACACFWVWFDRCWCLVAFDGSRIRLLVVQLFWALAVSLFLYVFVVVLRFSCYGSALLTLFDCDWMFLLY